MILKNGKRIDGCSDTVPIGTLNPFLGSTTPYGYLICQGQKVSKTVYKELYEICGDTFGQSTDTEFYLPDLRGQTIAGYKEGDSTFGTLGGLIGSLTHLHSTGNHTLTIDEMPTHYHRTEFSWDNSAASGGDWGYVVKTHRDGRTNGDSEERVGGSQPHNHGDTSSTSSIQPTIVLNWIVKAFQLMPNQSYVSSVTQDSDVNTYSCNYINDRTVKVSPEEPTTGENVWIEYSKNKLDPTIIKRGAYNSNGEFTTQNDIVILNANVKSNTNYIVSANSNVAGLLIVYFHNNTFIGGKFEGYNVKENQFTTPDNCNRVEIEVAKNFGTEMTQDIVNSLELQLESNIVRTKYEKYLTPNIKVNNNGSYETIVYSNTYSTEEQVIGTWMGKPLYRKVININMPNGTTQRHNLYNTGLSGIITRKIYGTMYVSGHMFPLPMYNLIVNESCLIYTTNNGESIDVELNCDFSNYTADIILEYTKIND